MNEQEFEKLLKQVLKFYNKKSTEVPQRVLDFDVTRITAVYKKAYSNILTNLVDRLSYNGGDFSDVNAITEMELLRQIDLALNQANVQVQEEITDYINKQYVNGQINHYIAVNGITNYETILKEFPFASINWTMANQLIADTMEDLLFATDNTKKKIKRIIRDTVSKHLQLNAIQGESYKTIKQLIIKDLQKQGLSKKIVKEGFVGVIDKGGRKWGLQNYADMVVKTKTHQAYIEGLKQQSMDTGNDLAVIPRKGATDPCANFEGMIISLTGQTKGYMTYEQLRATNLIFHPRCSHSPIPIHGADALHEEDIKIHQQKLEHLKKISKKAK